MQWNPPTKKKRKHAQKPKPSEQEGRQQQLQGIKEIGTHMP
jgi:hypothetical protein